MATLAALWLVLGAALSHAQAPPPVPALPDSERRTQYSVSGTTCACSVGFALYGSGTDVDSWIEVWVGGVRKLSTDSTFGWSLSSATGSLGTIPRPITNAVLTFNAVQTATVQIVGAERPRRTTQVAENRGVAARDFNQFATDMVAMLRENWDKTNDVTGRALVGLPGESLSTMPAAATRAGGYLCFDATGLIPQACAPLIGSGNVSGPNTSVSGHFACWNNSTGTVLKDCGTSSVVTPLTLATSGAVGDSTSLLATVAMFLDGSNATPVTTSPSVAISRVDARTSTASADAALWVNTVGTAAQTAGANGIYSFLVQNGTADGVAILGLAEYSGGSGHSAFGAYLEGNKTVATSGAFALQASIDNTASNDSWVVGSGFSLPASIGLDIVCGGGAQLAGTKNCTAAYTTRSAGSTTKFDVGLGLRPSSIVSTSIEDDSSSVTSFLVTGAHTSILDANSGSASSFFLRGPSATFTVDGVGNTTITQNLNASTTLTASNSNAGASATAGIILTNNTSSGVLQVIGSGNSGTGQVGANMLGLRAASGLAAVVIQTDASVPVIFASNSLERARFAGSGCLSVGNTTDCGAPGIINLLTGLRIGNAAASGHYLKGNGTNYVDGTIANADLPGTGQVTVGSTAIALGGTSTSLAGLTTVVAATSVTVPLVAGGTSGSSTLTLESTSGSGSTDSIIFQTGTQSFAGFINTSQQWSLGANVAPVSGVRLVVNNNSAQIPTATLSGWTVQLAAANNSLNRFGFFAAGTVPVNVINFVSSRGTLASPTASQSGDTAGAFGAVGYGTTGYGVNGGAGISFVTSQTWSDTAQGMVITFTTTPNNSNSSAEAMRVLASGGLAIGATIDPGTGGLFINGATITLNGLATDATHTDRTVCQDTTSKSLFFGSGAAGICLGTSSARFKHDIVRLAAGLDEIMKLDAVSYRLNSDHGDSDKLLYGFTAEQGIGALPDLVGLDNEGRPQTFDYMGVVPVLVRAVQELKADNDNLRSQLTALDSAHLRFGQKQVQRHLVGRPLITRSQLMHAPILGVTAQSHKPRKFMLPGKGNR